MNANDPTSRREQAAGAPADPVTELVHAFARARQLPIDGAPVATPDALGAAWDQLRAAGLDDAGLAFAEWNTGAAVSGPLLPILANSPDVAALLTRLQRFHPLFGPNEVVLDLEGAPATLSLRPIGDATPHPDTVDACFALLFRAIEQLTQGAARPDRVRLRRVAPSDPERYRRLLGDVRFGAATDRCEFDGPTLRIPIRHADPTILSMLEPYAARLVAKADEAWSHRVRAVVTPRLADRPSLTLVAAELAVSPRALQAHLQEEGVTFSGVLEDAQRTQALALLAAGATPVTEVARLVGFGSAAGFSRAFRRWTGSSPTDARVRR